MGGQQYDNDGQAAASIWVPKGPSPDDPKPELNLPYIKEVLAHIEANIKRLEMRTYFTTIDADGASVSYGDWPECGMKACFAGWGFYLKQAKDFTWEEWHNPRKSSTVHDTARELFGLTHDEANELFLGYASDQRTPEAQLKALKMSLNGILTRRGMTERV